MERVVSSLSQRAPNGTAEYLKNADPKTQQVLLDQIERYGGIDRILNDYDHSLAAHKKLSQGLTGSAVSYLPPVQVRAQDFMKDGYVTEEIVEMLKLSDLTGDQQKTLEKIGLQALADGRVAIVVMAAGQGTRLGFDHPKGMYRLDLPSKASIFELLMTRVKALNTLVNSHCGGKAGVTVWIMTSRLNRAKTEEFFVSENYFGLDKSTVKFFEQKDVPVYDLKTGDLLLADPEKFAASPNGNGGIFEALPTAELKSAGVEYIHVVGIDNVLCRLGDPLFIGACLKARVSVGNKCIGKRDAEEKIGVQVIRKFPDGVMEPWVVEYTEISQEAREATNNDGSLKYSSGNIVNHLIELKSVCNFNLNNYHVAIKKVPYWDPKTKKMVTPEEPNAMKLEYFVFDVFAQTSKVLCVEGSREEEFSPVKNKDGVDSPATARQDVLALHAKWLKAAGLPQSCEIRPGTTYKGEGVKQDDLLKLA